MTFKKLIIYIFDMRIINSFNSAERLDSDLLRTFLAIAEAGSFSKGADRILRSQSAASLQIKRLEELLGQPVFARHARGITLTPAGEQLRPDAQRIADLLDEILGELRPDSLDGSLRIGIPDEYGKTILPEIIAAFARDNSRVELDVRCGFSASFPEALSGGELDLAVHTVETENSNSHVLMREKTIWVGSRNHPTHEQDPLPVALFHRACWWRDRALEALEASGMRFRVVYTSESNAGIKAAITAGAAVGVLGESSVSEDLMVLSSADGFPALPDSNLVLEVNRRGRSPAVQAITKTIIHAFDQGLRRH